MAKPRILCLSGSTRGGSFNSRLAALAMKELALANVDVRQISLTDYPMPIFNRDDETISGPPENAGKLFDLFCAHDGIFIASPEYNASLAPLLKNSIDWISRVKRPKMPGKSAFTDRVFAVSAASPGRFGGYRGLLALRHVLELGLGAHVLAEQIAVPHCTEAFDDAGNLVGEVHPKMLKKVLDRLVEMAGYYARKA